MLEIQRTVLRILEGDEGEDDGDDDGVAAGSWRPTLMWMLWVEAADWRPFTKGEVVMG